MGILQEPHQRARGVGGFVHLRDEIKWHLAATGAGEFQNRFRRLGMLRNQRTLDGVGEIAQVTLVEEFSQILWRRGSKL